MEGSALPAEGMRQYSNGYPVPESGKEIRLMKGETNYGIFH